MDDTGTILKSRQLARKIYIDLLDLICFSATGVQTLSFLCATNTEQNICVGSFSVKSKFLDWTFKSTSSWKVIS